MGRYIVFTNCEIRDRDGSPCRVCTHPPIDGHGGEVVYLSCSNTHDFDNYGTRAETVSGTSISTRGISRAHKGFARVFAGATRAEEFG